MSFKNYIYTGVTFVDPAVAREQSSKSINPTTYDRYEKYHYTSGEMSKLDTTIGTALEKVIEWIKQHLKK